MGRPAESSRVGRRRWAEFVEAFVVGERPESDRPARPRARATRAGVRRLWLDGGVVVWRSRWGVRGALPLADIARVALVEIEYWSDRGTRLVLYALVFDRDQTVRLRVVAGGSPAAAGIDGKRRLRTFWEGAGVLLVREHSVLGRAKDYRRRWPEAFSLAHAYPFFTTALLVVAWVLGAGLLDRLLSG